MFQRERTVALVSLEKNWDDMTAKQRADFTNSVRTKAAVMLIQVTHFVEQKTPQKAKELLIQIADSCMCIKEPDEQILAWIQVSCSLLALIYRDNQIKKFKSSHGFDKKGWHNCDNVLVLTYNKFSGQFQMEEYEEGFVRQDVLQYVSKINKILFGCQNVENSHSLYVMFSSYWIPFTITITLLVLIFIFLGASQSFDMDLPYTQFEIPAMIIGGIFLLPLLMIFLKSLEQRDNTFFSKKLGQEIKRINMDCKNRGNGIQFMMPHGRQIDIKLDQLEDDYEDHIDQYETPLRADQTPQSQIMDKIKGLTREISKISGGSLGSLKY